MSWLGVAGRIRASVTEETHRWTEMDYFREWLGKISGRRYRFI